MPDVPQMPLPPVEPPAGIPCPEAFRVGELARYLHGSYFAQLTAFLVARDPRAPELLPPVEPGQHVPIGRLPAKSPQGGTHFHLPHFLEWARNTPEDEYERAALSIVLITLAGELADHDYFDHAPELELVRHLRNGVAHGNRFNITPRGAKQLATYPAHNRLAVAKSSEFEVTASLNGQEVLFGFMERGDVLDLIIAVNSYLLRMGFGDPLRP